MKITIHEEIRRIAEKVEETLALIAYAEEGVIDVPCLYCR